MDTLRTLRLVALLEGCSFVLLLAVAMPLKYAFDLPQAVRVVGMGHGVLFILFCLVTLRVSAAQGWAVGADAKYALPDQGGSLAADTVTTLAPVIALVFGQSGLIAGATLEGTKYTRIIP